MDYLHGRFEPSHKFRWRPCLGVFQHRRWWPGWSSEYLPRAHRLYGSLCIDPIPKLITILLVGFYGLDFSSAHVTADQYASFVAGNVTNPGGGGGAPPAGGSGTVGVPPPPYGPVSNETWIFIPALTWLLVLGRTFWLYCCWRRTWWYYCLWTPRRCW